MGFSVSGSAVLIFVGMFIALGTAYNVAANTAERVQEAEMAHQEDVNTIHAHEIGIEFVEQSELGSCGVTANVTNTGTGALSLNATDVLLDNVYQTGWQDEATVDDDADTDLWLPKETLSFTVVNENVQPDHLKVVTGSGVAVSTEVPGFSC
jgi:flagellar protein FlaF